MNLKILEGDCRRELADMPDASVHCCVTSPPYFGLRDYGVDGQIGLEQTPDEYVAQMVEVFREVRRVLRDDGTLWLNLGDSYAGSWGNYGGQNRGKGKQRKIANGSQAHQKAYDGLESWRPPTAGSLGPGLKPKDMIGVPWRVAFALQADGWYLRQDIIWAKPNPMPESVEDRCTKAHEYLFLLSKSDRYFYDYEAIKEPSVDPDGSTSRYKYEFSGADGRTICPDDPKGQRYRPDGMRQFDGKRNRRSVWTVATSPYPEAHFATYPPDLIKPCVLAGTSSAGCCAKCGAPYDRIVEKEKGDPASFNGSSFNKGKTSAAREHLAAVGQQERTIATKISGWQPICKCESAGAPIPCAVLDPFAGSGTTGKVALELGRSAILIELNPEYVKLIEKRCRVNLPLMFEEIKEVA